MTIRPLDYDAELPMVISWLDARGMEIKNRSDFPSFGLIAYNDNIAVAAIFIRNVEGGYAIVDGLVTNPQAAPKDRHEANDKLTSKILKIAKYNGIISVMAWSEDENTIIRAINTHGFVYSKGVVLLKAL